MPTRMFRLLSVTFAVVVGQAILLVVDPQATTLSNLLTASAVLFAATGCFASALDDAAENRSCWLLLATAFLLSAAGQISSTYDEAILRTHTQTTALNSDLLFFMYGIPVLLAICSGGREGSLRILELLDGTQAILAAALVYPLIFSALPSLGDRTPVSARDLMYLYDIENMVLAAAVTLRLLCSPRGQRRRFYQSLTLYLWVYAFIAALLGYVELERNLPDGVQDALWGVPYLALLGFLAFRKPDQDLLNTRPDRQSILELLIDNLSPGFFTLAIVLMGIRVAPAHKWFGTTCIVAAVAIYGFRAALLQGKYVSSQEELTRTTLALLSANERLTDLSSQDGLTGIHNRRRFDEALQHEWDRSMGSERELSLLMIDIDCFKELNDLYGHQVGDQCLRGVAQELQSLLDRPNDLLARYGGEEFAIILPGASREGALLKAEEIRHAVAELRIPNLHSLVENIVTVSVGLCTGFSYTTATAEEFLKRADQALYVAKANGRNQSHVLSFP